MKKKLLVLSILCFCRVGFSQTTYLVDAGSTASSPDGLTWSNAFNSITDAVNAASNNDTILVKQGIYSESIGVYGKTINFYGGFNGTETYAYQSDPKSYTTVFNGDVNGDDVPYMNSNKADNLDYFLYFQSCKGEFHIDGFTFMFGYNNGGWANRGGAIVIRDAYTGTITAETICKIDRCTFLFNTATGEGGAIYTGSTNNNGVVKTYINRCWFEGNACGIRASAIFNYAYGGPFAQSLMQVTNSVFKDNHDPSLTTPATVYGASSGAVSNASVSVTNVVNCTFYNNTGAYLLWNGGTSMASIAAGLFRNNIVWNPLGSATNVYIGNSGTASNNYQVYIQNNDIHPGPTGIQNNVTSGVVISGNIHSDPKFQSISTSNYLLAFDSPCIDEGDTSQISYVYPNDLDFSGDSRFNGTVDMGAFEYYTGVGIPVFFDDQISVYPNPAQNYVFVEGKEGIAQVVAIDGRIIATRLLQDKTRIDISAYPSGVYVIRFQDNSSATFIKH